MRMKHFYKKGIRKRCMYRRGGILRNGGTFAKEVRIMAIISTW